ncbi:MAG: sulfite exporter TauE/SafE family protein, partial [Mariprofundaceae bacterium]|nr:sulfite exporter TauE/SafE family protein [Mariprofundaceae bacterium]
MTTVLVAGFMIGFLGSMHCIGMCGGLVTALSISRPDVWWTGLAAYQAGRVSTYVLLGLLTGLLGAVLTRVEWIDSAQQILALLAGVMMVAFGMHLAGLMTDPFQKFLARFSPLSGLLKWIKGAAAGRHPVSWYMVGILNGLLPCGLVYAALAMALASGEVPRAGLIMLAFGLGTVPAMMFVPVLMRKLTPRMRGGFLKVAGVVLVVLGLMTAVRGADWMHAMHSGMEHGTVDHGAMDHGTVDHGTVDHGTVDHG